MCRCRNQAGQYIQGNDSVAIGNRAGQGIEGGPGQHSNSIIINASGNALNSVNDSCFYVNPIRIVTNKNGFFPLYYDSATSEIVAYNDAAA